MIGTAQHWSETMNALIAVIFVLLDTGMGQDADISMGGARQCRMAGQSLRWLAIQAGVPRHSGDCAGPASIVIQATRHRCACSRCGIRLARQPASPRSGTCRYRIAQQRFSRRDAWPTARLSLAVSLAAAALWAPQTPAAADQCKRTGRARTPVALRVGDGKQRAERT